uniref:Uncharacterized protein n=1 Tax=Romanomermis culicivorax TaxID=13658 RepID=A0A915LAY8_ROMCU
MIALEDEPFKHLDKLGIRRLLQKFSSNQATIADVIPTVCWLGQCIEKKESRNESGIGTFMDDLRGELGGRFDNLENKS